MTILNPTHTTNNTPPRPIPLASSLPIVEKTKILYTAWIAIHRKIPRTERFGLGVRINNAFLDLLTALRRASFLDPKRKIPLLEIAIVKIDDLKFLVQLLWENRLMSNEQFISFGKDLETIGKNVGGWKKDMVAKQIKAPTTDMGEKLE